MTVLCVTGTSTDVGKTVVTAAIAALAAAEGIAVRVCKPIQTGVGPDEPGDLQRLDALSGCRDLTEFVRLPEPMAPQDAARRAGATLPSRAELVGRIAAIDRPGTLTLVEGAGGLLVRLTADDATLLDVAADLGASLLVVTTTGLGTLNHTELTTRVIAGAGVRCVGLAIGSWPAEPTTIDRANRLSLPTVTGAALRGEVPAGSGNLPAAEFLATVTGRFDIAGLIPVATPRTDPVTRVNGTVVG